MATRKKKTDVDSGTPVQIPLNWDTAEDIQTVYANQMSIIHTPLEFYLTFGELTLPPDFGIAAPPNQLTIKPRVRLAISPDAMRNMMNVMQENFDKFLEKNKDEHSE